MKLTLTKIAICISNMQLPEGDIQVYYAVVFCIRHFCTSFYIFIFAYHFNMFCMYLYVRMSLSDKTDYTYDCTKYYYYLYS